MAEERCRVLHESARSLSKAGQYAAALSNYESAYALEPSAHWLLVNIGRVHQKLGHLREAIEAYRRFLKSTGAQADPDLSKKAKEFLDQAEQDLTRPSLPKMINSKQPTVAIMVPKVKGSLLPQDLALIEKSVQTALQEQQFQVASKSERDSIESAGNLKNCYRNDCLEQLGRLLGANLVLAYKIKVDIVEVPVLPAPPPPPEPKRRRSAAAQAQAQSQDSPEPPPANTSPLVWEVTTSLYNIEVGAIGARLDMKCEHCSGPQVAQNVADLVKRAVLEDASKQREVLEILSEPANSSVLVDGVELGITPYKRATFVGKHEITIRHTGYKSINEELIVIEGRKTSRSVQLEPGQDPIKYIAEYQPRPKWRIGLGAGMLGLGLIGVGVGAYSLAVDGKCVEAPMPPAVRCMWIYDGVRTGIGFLIPGVVLSVAGGVVMLLPGKRNPLIPAHGADTFGDKDTLSSKRDLKPAKSAPQAALSIGGMGSGLGFQFMGVY